MVLTSIALLLLAINGVLAVRQLNEQEERINKVYKFLREQNTFNRVINNKIDNVNERLGKKEKE